jgi:two-component system, cell cycle sensor histidine kinase and response regulator CckA
VVDLRSQHEELASKLADHEVMLSSIAANLPGVIYQFSAQGNQWSMRYMSEKAEEIFGISSTRDKFIEAFIPCLPKDDQQLFIASILEAIENESSWTYEGRFIRPDGGEIYFRGNSILTKKGAEFVYHGLLLDITDQHKAEQEREEQTQILNAITTNLPGVVYEYTIDEAGNGNVTYVSARSLEIFGVPAEPSTFNELFLKGIPEKDRENHAASVAQATAVGMPWYYEGAFNHPNGEAMYFHAAAVPSERQGKVVYHGILLDQTNQERIQEELRHNQRLESIGQLAGGVAHDFNNMLGGIMGAAELLVEEHKSNPDKSSLAQLIVDTAARAGELTWQLLTFSRKAVTARKPQSIHEIIHRTCQILERSIDRRITIERSLEAERETVLGDPAQLQAAFLNLAVNARDAMPEGGLLRFETAISNYRRDASHPGRRLPPGDYLRIRVVDTGGGIPESVRPRIFEPFFTTKPIGQGTGMGLAAVYGTIAEHGGSVNLLETSSDGSSFEIFLPLSEAANSDITDNSATPRANSAQRVLLIDDEKIVRHTAKRLMESLGYEVDEAEDGIDGIERFQSGRGRYDIVVLDMVMPRLNGEDAFRRLREIQHNIPIVLCSGFSLDESVTRLRAQGLAGHLTKPFRRKQLGDVLRQVVSGSE